MRFSGQVRDIPLRLFHSELTTVEAAGLANAIAGVSVSFDRGLLPRTTPQQAALTGLWGATTYGITATTQSLIESVVRRLGAARLQSPHARRAALMAGDAAAIAAGIALQKALPQRPDEPLVRAGGRAAGWRLTLGGSAGLLALTADGVHDTLTRTHEEQSVSTVASLLAGTAVAAGMYLWRSRKLIDTGVDTDEYGEDVAANVKVQPIRAAAVGIGVSGMLFGVSRAERTIARTVGSGIAFVAPATAPYARTLGHAVTFAAGTYAVGRGIDMVYHKTEVAGVAVEAAYANRPDSASVSGGSASAEDWETFGREGRRYVNMALTADEIAAVTGGSAKDPIRAYVGLGTDVSPNRRAARALRELEVLGAFDRAYIAVFFPTGTGYVNYVALESLEYFTGGDVASIAIQYSVRPSFLSLGEVGTARESNLLLLNRLAERLDQMPQERRPKVLLFGESLGSLGGQNVLNTEGTDDLDLLRVHRALFIGTPYASEWRQRWLAQPQQVDPQGIVAEINGIEDWRALPQQRRDNIRVLLLTHHNDPIPKFGGPLIIQQPDWLGRPEDRPPGIPKESLYIPGLTFYTTAIDLLNADHVVPGRFEAWAHDYRADLAEVVAAAYGLSVEPGTMASVEAALRRRELAWAERRLASEKLQKAEEQIRSTIAGWGIDSASVPRFVEANRPVAEDPYAVTE